MSRRDSRVSCDSSWTGSMAELPEGWRIAALSDTVELQRGFDLPAQARQAGLFPVLTSGEGGGFHNQGPVAGPGFVVGRATNLGRPRWSSGDFWPHNTTMFAKDFKGNEPRWLFHLFEVLDLSGYDSGSVQPMLNRNYIAQVKVLVPPLPEQRAIAEVLGALDDKIAANTALAAAADRYGSTVLDRSLTTDRVRLDSLALITMGSSPAGETLNEAGDGMPFYQGVRDFGFRSPSRRVFTTSPVRTTETGDILISVRAPVGDINVADESLCIGRGIAAAQSSVNAPATLFYQLKGEREAWEPFEAEGTVFGSINRDQLHGIQLRPVAHDLVVAVEQELSSLEASIKATLAENRTLAAIRDTLLPHLMSGRLSVRDAEASTSEVGA